MFRIKSLVSFFFIGLFIGVTVGQACAFRIVQISDTHIVTTGEHTPALNAIVTEVNSSPTKTDFVLSTGDYTDTGATDQYALYSSLISRFSMPVYNAIGNHEVKWSTWGKAGSERFLHQKPHHSFDWKGIHFVAIDSTFWLEHNSFIDPAELVWLKHDLKRVGKSKPVVLFCHHCSNYILNEPAFLKVLEPYNVKLALVGHEHAWGTRVRNGVHFETDASAYDGAGFYRIVDFNENEIRTFKKEVGKEPVLDEVIDLRPAKNPVRLTSPKESAKVNGDFSVTAEAASQITTVEIGVDNHYLPARKTENGKFTCQAGKGLLPGRHIISVRGRNADRAEWLDSKMVSYEATKREAWRFHAKGGVQRRVTISGDRAFFGCNGGGVYCLDASTGKQAWYKDLAADVISKVAIDGDVAYLGITNGDFVALSAETGEELWRTPLGAPILASPVVQGGVVYIGGGDGVFHALDAATGASLWKTETGGMIQETPLIFQDGIFFGNWEQKFLRLDRRTGRVNWKLDVGGWKGYSPACGDPVAHGSKVLFTDIPWEKADPDIVAVDAKTGSKVWGFQTAGEESGCGQGGACVSGDMVTVCTSSGYLVSLRASDGKELWRSRIGQPSVGSSPISAQGKVITCGMYGVVSIFDEKSGSLLWSYSSGPGCIYGNPTYWKGLILVPSLDGTVTALHADLSGK